MAYPSCQSPVLRGFFFVSLALLWTTGAGAREAGSETHSLPMASCEADYGGRTEKLSLPPTTDVYATQSATLGNRFRFQAQYLSGRSKLKTWVYELRERGPLLLHAAEYPLPADACSAGTAGSTDFGLNKVYSSDFERELFFRCSSLCK